MGKRFLPVLLILSLVITFMVGAGVFGCKAGEEAAEPEGGFYIGHVSIWNVDWYAYLGNAMDLIAEKYDTEIYRIFSDFTVEKEVAGIEDMITREVDGIILGSVSADSAQQAAQKCNEADIPLVIENSALGEGPGTVVSDVEFDWYGLGVMSAEVTAENYPGTKVLLMTGTLGTGPIDLLLQGWEDTADGLGLETVKIIPTDYLTEKALAETQNVIQSGLEFDVVWGHGQVVTEGVIEGLKSADVLGDYVVLSCNGGPVDIANLEEGELDGAISYSPGFHGLLCFLSMYYHLAGKDVPDLTYVPMKYITQDDPQGGYIWEMDESFVPIAEEYMETGKADF
jgi:ABC-type sugar transport system substrate-binding protein